MLRLPKLFQDGCVLQQGSQCRIWGWCDPGEEVRLSFAIQKNVKETVKAAELSYTEESGMDVVCREQVSADMAGLFAFVVQTPPAGGPYLMRVRNSSGEELTFHEVYVGEVFVCAGQSNMELPMSRVCERFPEEFQNGGAPDVHEYKVTEHYDFNGPLEDHVQAEWRVCTGERLPGISAFAYFFGKELAGLKNVPVGVLNLSLGGTPAEAWMSREGLGEWPDALKQAEVYKDKAFCRSLTDRETREEEDWQREIAAQEEKSASAPWHPAVLPGELQDWGLKNFCGCIYLRKTFSVPSKCLNENALLRLGTLVDSDTVYINGRCVGETTYRYPPRRYPVPAGFLKEGENEILIRLVCRSGEGRSTVGQPLELVWEDGKMTRDDHRIAGQAGRSAAVCEDDLLRMALAERGGRLARVSLSGAWEYQVRAVCNPAPGQTFISWMPTGLFYGMVAPCLPYQVRGVLWYQGESNDSRAQTYGAVLEGLIRDWRKNWRQEKLPFVVIQLPNCGVDVAPDDAWPRIREAQKLAGQLEDVAFTVNLDAGEDNDLHPRDKKTVASRALSAVRTLVYREKVEWRAPEVCSWERLEERWEGMSKDCVRVTGKSAEICEVETEKACVCLHFDGQVTLRLRPNMQDAPDNPRLFELAGDDEAYYPALARVDGDRVFLQADEVAAPRYVRYAWFRAPGPLLLYGENGFCVSPFRIHLARE